MKNLKWWTSIVLLLISQTYATSVESKTQESDLKTDAKELIKAAASSAEYSSALANDYSSEKQQESLASSSSSVSSSVDSGNYDSQSQYSQPLSYSQPGTPLQPIHSYSQPLNYAPSALPYTAESSQQSTSQQYNSGDSASASGQSVQSQYGPLKEVPEIPSPSNSQYQYPQYPASQQYNPSLLLQQQSSAPVSDYLTNAQGDQGQYSQSQYDGNQATYVQPVQHQQVYLQQHHYNIPGSSHSEQSYVVENDKNAYPQTNSYSQPLPPEYSQEYSNNAHGQSAVSGIPAKPKKTVILAIPVKLVAKNKYNNGQSNAYSQNNAYSQSNAYSQPEIQSHYSSNVVPAAASLPVTHSSDKNNYGYSNENSYDKQAEKPSFNEKPLYSDKPAYTEKAEEYGRINHNLNNNLQGNGYNGGEYESDSGDHYRPNGLRGFNYGPHKQSGPIYNSGREIKPLSNYQSRPRGKPSYGSPHGDVYSTDVGPAHIEEEITYHPGSEHSNNYGPSFGGEIEHNHIHSLHKPHKVNDVYEPVDHLPPPYIPSDFPSLSGPLTGISSYPNPMDLIYSSPYKLGGGGHPSAHQRPSYRPSLLGSGSAPSPSTMSSSNYGQFLSSLLNAYSLGGFKQSSSKPASSSKGLASYFSGLDLLKGYGSALSPSYTSSILSSASGLNKIYTAMPNTKQQANKPNYIGWPSSLSEISPQQQQQSKPSGLLASSSNIVSSIDELFKSSLNPSKFKRPLYSDATRAITNFYKKLLN